MSQFTATRTTVGVSKQPLLDPASGRTQRIGIAWDLIRYWGLQAARGEDLECTVLLIFLQLLTIVWAILFSLRVDGYVSASWVAIWTPLWIVNVAGLLFFAIPVSQAAVGFYGDAGNAPYASLLPWYRRLLELTKLTLLLLFQVLLTLRLDGTISCSWTDVMLPVFAWSLLWFVADIYILNQILPGLACKKYLYILLHFGQLSLQVWQVIMLMLKLDRETKWNWWVVFTPTWVAEVVMILSFCWGSIVFAMLTGKREVTIEEKEQTRRARKVTSMTLALVPGDDFFAWFAVLRIFGTFSSTFLVLSPLFLVVGLGLGCLLCAFIPAGDESNVLLACIKWWSSPRETVDNSDRVDEDGLDET